MRCGEAGPRYDLRAGSVAGSQAFAAAAMLIRKSWALNSVSVCAALLLRARMWGRTPDCLSLLLSNTKTLSCCCPSRVSCVHLNLSHCRLCALSAVEPWHAAGAVEEQRKEYYQQRREEASSQGFEERRHPGGLMLLVPSGYE